MKTPFGFIIWRDEDDFCPPGQKAKLFDGQCVSLYQKVKKLTEDTGKNVSEFEFKLVLEKGGQAAAEHVFKTNDTNNFWLIADPSASDENGTFTSVFLTEFANSPVGEHDYLLKLFADGEILHDGEITYISDGQNPLYKELIPKFKDISGTREEANKKHQQEYAEQSAKEEREKEAAREYKIQITNVDSGHTKYILETHQTTLSENIHQITPMQTITLSLFRGSRFELKFYDQDSSKDNAILLAMVDESCHNKEYIVK